MKIIIVIKTLLLAIILTALYLRAPGIRMPYQYPLFLSSNKKYEAIFHDHNIIAIYLVEENKCREMYRIIIEDYVPQEIFVSDCGRVLICGPDYYRDTVDDEAIVVYIDGKKKKSIQYAIFLI